MKSNEQWNAQTLKKYGSVRAVKYEKYSDFEQNGGSIQSATESFKLFNHSECGRVPQSMVPHMSTEYYRFFFLTEYWQYSI